MKHCQTGSACWGGLRPLVADSTGEREMWAVAPLQARGALAWLIRHRWAMTVLCENARLNIERMEYVGQGAAAAAERRWAFDGGAHSRRSVRNFWQGP